MTAKHNTQTLKLKGRSRRGCLALIALGLILGGLSSAARAADTQAGVLTQHQRVFVCGHSFHIYIAKLLPEVAQAAGLTNCDLVGQQMLGGSTVLQHWNLPDIKNKAKAALRAGQVDVLTLSPHIMMPDPGIDNFTKLGLQKNPKLRVFVQESWPAYDGVTDPQTFRTNRAVFRKEQRDQTPLAALRVKHAVWQRKVEAQVKALNESVGRQAVFIVPTCDAVMALRELVAAGKVPGIAHQTELFRDEIGHPQPPIAVLNAYCHLAAIFHRNPVGLPVPAEWKVYPQAAALNRLLEQLAWDAVRAHPMSGLGKEAK